MDNIRRFYCFTLLTFLTATLMACGGGGGGGSKNPPVQSQGAITSQANSSSASSLSNPDVPVFETTLTLGAPTTNPVVIPPSATGVQVKFLAVARGTYYPDQITMDEVDKNGALIQANILQLKDDGEDADAFRGDRTYSGQLELNSVFSTERLYRVHAQHKGAQVMSGTGRLWVSGCPSVARPSNPEKAVMDPQSGGYVFANELLVTLADTVAPDLGEINAIMAAVQGQVVGCIPALRQYLVEIGESTSASELYSAINTLKANAKVVEATPNAVVLNMPGGNNADCDGFECQWYLDRIRAPQAWSLVGGGDEQSSVAIIDFGVNCSNPELNCNSGIVSEDPIDHGTGVASLIGARKGDGTAMIGVAWNTELYPFSFIGSGGSQYKMSELITLSMAKESIRVINISAATATDPGNQIRNAMCSAIDSGRLIVAAAGNASTANSCKLTNVYPAIYNSSGQCANGANLAKGLLVVGATDADNNLAQWEDNNLCSNTLYVDVFAPGKDIYAATAVNGNYSAKNGTSFAAPLVAGSAAVLWASQPSLTVPEVHDQLLTSAATFSQTASGTRNKTADARLDGKSLVDLFAAVGGKDSQPAPDLTPDTFSFVSVNQVNPNTIVTSAPVTISGIDASVPVDIIGGFYSIDNGPFTSAAGRINPNQSLRVQLRSSATALATAEATLTVSGVSKTFQVTTIAATPPQPANFDFYDIAQAQPGALVTSNILRISGIATGTAIAVSGGEYALDGGAFTAASGTVGPNQDIQIRVKSAATPATTVTAVVTIGGVSDNFRVTTHAVDTNPDAFTFAVQSNVAPGTLIESNTITLAGINTAALISISGGEYSVDGGSYTAIASAVVAGQTVKIRHKSALAFGSDTYSTLTIGDYSATFHSRTSGNAAPVASNLSILDINGGAAEVGDILTGRYTYTDADKDTQGATSFRWLRGGVAISNATSVNYTLVASDIGKDIQFEVTPRATTGVLEGVAKVSAAITTSNSAPKASNITITDTNGAPLITGDTLTASFTYQDADGDLQGTSTYRWLRNGVAISGATNASYQVTSSDIGQMIAVEITPVALSGKLTGAAVTSGAVVSGNTAPQAASVAISGATSGKSVVGASLTGTYSFSDIDGDAEGTSTYQWFRNGTAISGATSKTYVVTTSDSGQSLAFAVTPIAAAGTAQGVNVRSGTIAINSIPVAQAVTIVDTNGGSLVVGDTLTGNYTYSDSDSDTQGTSKFRWLRNGSAINGATAQTYKPISSDSGQSIVFEVTPVASAGSFTGTAVRSTAITVSNSAPVATNVAIVDANGGSATLGDVLNGSFTYSDADGDTQGATTFRWLRNGATVVSTSQSYTLAAADSGQTLEFRVTPRASSGVVLGTEVASSTITAASFAPNVFTFTAVTNAALSSTVVSNAITVSGINTSVPISVSGGQYAINGGTYTSSIGTVSNGQTVTLRLTSSASSNTATQATLTIGGVSASFSVTTLTVDTTPAAFNFTAVTGAAVATAITSNAITVSGINTPAAISISGGQYSINGGTFTSTAGTVSNGQTVAVRLTSSPNSNTTTQATLSIGGVTGSFSITTITNLPPTILSSSTVSINENIAQTGYIPSATDPEGQAITFSLGGTDAALFFLSPGTGELMFTSPPDYENPKDGDTNNIYQINLIATDSKGAQNQLGVSITVKNEARHLKVELLFPTPGSDVGRGYTTTTTVMCRAVDLEAGGLVVTSGTANGASLAETTTGSGIWFAQIPASPGSNSLNISFNLQSEASPLTLASTFNNRGAIKAPTGLALDPAKNSLYIIDAAHDSLIKANLTTGHREVIGDLQTWTDMDVFWPQKIRLHDSNTKLLVNDSWGGGKIFDIDLSTGARTIVKSYISSLAGIELDATGTSALVSTSSGGSIFKVDLNSKTQTIVADTSVGTGDSLGWPYDIAANATFDNYVVASQRSASILTLDTTTGNRSIIASSTIGTGAALGNPNSVTFTPNDNSIWVGDSLGVLEIDLSTQIRKRLLTTDFSVFDIAPDSTNNRLLLSDRANSAIWSMNNSTFAKTSFIDGSVGEGKHFNWGRSVVHDEQGQYVYVGDSGIIHRVILATGERQILTQGLSDEVYDMAIDSANNHLYALTLSTLFRIDLATGNRTVVTSSTTGSGQIISKASGLAIDPINKRGWVVDYDLDAVVHVDLATGNRTVLSNATTGQGQIFNFPFAIAMDTVNNRLLVSEGDGTRIFTVNINNGDRAVLSDTSSQGPTMKSIREMKLDALRNRALVVTNGGSSRLPEVLSVDLTSGNRTAVSLNGTLGTGPAFVETQGISVDGKNHRVFLMDSGDGTGALLNVSLKTGDRVIVSQ